jgi:outer membrane protein assembly factor BamA
VVESALTGDFNERHYDINGTLGKRLDLYRTAAVNLGYHIVNISQYRQGRTASTDGTDRFLYGTVSYTFDSRDLREYPMQGAFYSLAVSKDGFGESPLDFARYSIDARRYFPLGADFSLATRAYTSLVTGRLIPTYAHSFIGYGEQVRGYFNTIIEGEDIAGVTLELRCPILKARTIIFRAIPLPPEFAIWRFGISLALFADAGNAWYRKERLQLRSFASGYGAGIHFLLPYGYVARVEYAFNDYGRGQFIFDLRSSI